jgi:hypothetical protein
MATWNVDSDLMKKLAGGLDDNDAVKLPFPVVYLWAQNGQAAYASQKKDGSAMYFGGWACKQENANEVIEETGSPLPYNWKPETIGTRDGGTYDAYVARTLYVAPIAKRESWIGKDGKRYPKFVDGARNHTQYLAYLGVKKAVGGEKGGDWRIDPWGLVVLTAKGYQAMYLRRAFSDWAKATAKARGGAYYSLFYALIGTFGKEREVANVGKQGATSPVTPLKVWLPDEEITETLLKRMFVGDVVAGIMGEKLEQAAEWLGAWKKGEVDPEQGGEEYGEAAPEREWDF